MAYNKEDLYRVSVANITLIKGLRDGLDEGEIANLTGLLMAAVQAIDEFKENWQAAGLHMMGKMADLWGDDLLVDDTPTIP